MKKNEELYDELTNAKYGDLFFCGFKDRNNDVKRILENKLINNMNLLEFLRKEKCESHKHGWNYYFLKFDILKNQIKEVKEFITLNDGFVDTSIIAKYPLSKSQLLHLMQEEEAEDDRYKKLFDEIAERNYIDAIREDSELRERMG